MENNTQSPQGFDVEHFEPTDVDTYERAESPAVAIDADFADEEEEQLIKNKLVIPTNFSIQNEAVNLAIIQDKIKELGEIVIGGIDDKDNYDKVRKATADLRTTRTGLEKWRKAKSKPYQEFVKNLKSATDKLGEECKKGEAVGEALMKPIDDEKERIKREKEEAAQKALQERFNALVQYGASFDGDSYTFPHDESLFISAIQVKEFDLAEFSEFLNTAKVSWEAEQKRIADEAEATRIANEAKEAELSALKARLTKLRTKELKITGFVQEGAKWVLGKHVVTQSLIETMEDSYWDAMILQAEEDAEELASTVVETGVVADSSGFDVADDMVDLNALDNVLDSQKIADEAAGTPETLFEYVDPALVSSVLEFTSECMFVDVDINAKFFQRFYPRENEVEALDKINSDFIALKNTQVGSFNLYFSLIDKAALEAE